MSAYQYIESGLSNVFIEGLDFLKDEAGDDVVHIPFVAQLHAEIARGIVQHKGPMTPDEIRFVRSEMGMTQSELAKLLGLKPLTVGRWERGETKMDVSNDAVIRRLAIERLLDKFDASIEQLVRNVGSARGDDGAINIRARSEGYVLAA